MPSLGCLAKGLEHKEEAASNERLPPRSSEPFGETRLLLSSVPLSVAPPQNGLVFFRPLVSKVFKIGFNQILGWEGQDVSFLPFLPSLSQLAVHVQ